MKEFIEFDWHTGVTFPLGYIHEIFRFAREGQFKKGLEIGFDSGSSALAFLRACPDAILLSVDIAPCKVGHDLLRHHGVGGGLEGTHSFIQGDSHVVMKQLIEKGEKYDYIFVDGDHLYDGARQDLEDAVALLDENGCILVDDCQPDHGHFKVFEAVEDVCAKFNLRKVSLGDHYLVVLVKKKI